MSTDQDFELLFPSINWRKPVQVRLFSGVSRLCCRLCIARQGLNAAEVEKVGFQTEEEFQQHLRQNHSRAEAA